MALVISIAGTDRTKLVEKSSLKITNVLTNSQDSCEFTVRKFGDRTFEPAIDDEVIITNDGTRIFGGHIIELHEDYGKIDDVSIRVTCTDYTRHMDNRLVAKNYEDMEVADIIADIRSRYMPSDIDLSGVTAIGLVNKASFHYEYPSDCLRQLAEIVGAEWYIDYDKTLYFFQQNEIVSPFNLTDTNGKYVYESLRVRQDNSQLRNIVIVKGGDYLANVITAAYVAESGQKHYLLPYKFSNLQANVTGQIKNIGVDPLEDETLYDGLHNFQEKMVKFRADKSPSVGSAVRISGNPHLPVIVKVQDPASIETFTAREFIVIDKSLKSKEAARERGYAELAAYKQTVSELEFRTYIDGLKSGQTINVQSDLRGVDQDFIINRVDLEYIGVESDGTAKYVYKVSGITTRTYDYIQLLKKLINRQKKDTTFDEIDNPLSIVDLVESAVEGMSLSEVVTAYLGPDNLQQEAMSIQETVTGELEFGTIFVLGPWTPTDN